jgi:hypothetical protein
LAISNWQKAIGRASQILNITSTILNITVSTTSVPPAAGCFSRKSKADLPAQTFGKSVQRQAGPSLQNRAADFARQIHGSVDRIKK